MTDLELSYARTCSTPHGVRVLEHLRKITIERVLSVHATDAEMRSLESQRFLVHQIETLVSRGRGDEK